MKQFRFHTAASVLLAAALALTGCSGGGIEQESDPEPSQGEGGQVTLSMHSWRVEDTEGYAKLIEAFEAENPNIKIEFKPFKATEYNTILNTALQSDSGPDILQLRPYAPGISLAEAGYLEPLDSLPGITSFPKDVLAAATGKDGKIYGVPLSLNSTQFFYNKKIFEQNGLQEPKRWDELIATAKALKEKGIVPISFGAKEGWLLSLSHGVIAPASFTDGYVDKLLKGESDLTSPDFLASIQRMQELIPYFPENYAGLDLNDMRTLFANQFKRISAVPGVTTDDPLVNKMAELSQSSSIPYLMVVHFAEGNPTTKQVLENALQGMYLNKLTPEQVVEEVQKSAATWFAPFKK